MREMQKRVPSVLLVLASLVAIAGAVAWFLVYQTPRTLVTVVLTDHRIEATPNWARRGDFVQLQIINRGREVHELEIEGYDREVEDIRPGERRVLSFRATRSGEFGLVCHLEDHYELGMHTTFRVMD